MGDPLVPVQPIRKARYALLRMQRYVNLAKSGQVLL